MSHTTVWKIIKKIGTTLVSGDWNYPRSGRPKLKTDCSYPSTDKKTPGRSCDATLTEVAGTWLLQLV